MSKNYSQINKIISLGVLAISAVVYALTVAPTVSYWDCGEYIASAFSLGVPHPPGNPSFTLVARLFAMLATSRESVALMVNSFSAVSATFCNFFVYLSIMRFFKEFRGPATENLEFVTRAVSAVIGTLCLAFCHSYWFSAVESEMYIHHMLFIAMIVWLMLRWGENHEKEGSERYILLIAFLIGFSIGFHLLTVLILPFITLYAYKHKIVEKTTFKFVLALGVAIVLTGIIFPGVVKFIPAIIAFTGTMYFGLVIIIALIAYSYWLTVNKKNKLLILTVNCFLLLIIGYSSYAIIYIRSGLNPILDMGNPENITSFQSYINREQYGDLSLFPRHWRVKGANTGKNWIGDGNGVLHRFPNGEIRRVKTVEELGQNAAPFEHLGAQIEYFWNYQIDHMFLRYIYWNYLGVPEREQQDASADPSKLWGLPLILCLIGAIYMFYRDRDSAWAVFAIWFMFGLAVIIYLNQNDPQPRERDYSLVAIFMAMSVWISYGCYAIIEYLRELNNNKYLSYAVLAVLFLLLPARMLQQNFKGHNRSGNYVALEYSRNMLKSAEPNAILFNMGDNDTYPIWYLQIVEGIRRDVSAVNLSLVNTPWYIKQQKNGQIGRAVPITLNDAQIDDINIIRWDKERTLNIPVDSGAYLSELNDYTEYSKKLPDSSSVPANISFRLRPQMQVGTPQGPVGILRVQDQLVMNIILSNKWERPINWAVTVGSSNLMDGLKEYMRMDGLIYKLTPMKNWQFDPSRLEDLLLNQYSYKNLNNKDVYFNDNIVGLLGNYRSSFLQLAQYYGQNGDLEKQKYILNKMNELIDPEVVPINNPGLQLNIEILTKLDNNKSITADSLNRFSVSELDNIWQSAHFLTKNIALRNAGLEALINRLNLNDNKRLQYIRYLLEFNKADSTLKTMYKNKFLEE
ncbi:MAG: DUF2723 domain-containing protein, partial [Calditrichaeota bacterium]|nr:DUF2723 domain-containing protein [Calditrichota bacterium]